MKQQYELSAAQRTLHGKAVKTLRQKGIIPAVIYGHQTSSLPLELSVKAFLKVWQHAGNSSLVNLTIDGGESMAVLIQNVDTDPQRGDVLHVDFHRVRLDEEITTEIPLEFVGVAPAVKELSGIFVRSLDHVKVRCLPAALVPTIPVDLSSLKTFEDAITVGSIPVPAGITIVNAPGETVAVVQAPMSEEEFKKLEEKPIEAVESVEVVKKVKENEEELQESSAKG